MQINKHNFKTITVFLKHDSTFQKNSYGVYVRVNFSCEQVVIHVKWVNIPSGMARFLALTQVA